MPTGDFAAVLQGPGGALLLGDDFEPLFLLSTTIRSAEFSGNATQPAAIGAGGDLHDFKAMIVLWHDKVTGRLGFTFFNNHKDKNADMESFTVDGRSTSIGTLAIGEKVLLPSVV